MPIRPKRLTLRNWTTIREAVIEFPRSGVVLIVGLTEGADGKQESVGAGKTAVGEALCRSLLGVDGRFAALGHFCHDEVNEDCYVKLEADLPDGTPLVVEMGYKCEELSRTGEGLRFRYGTTEIWRDRVKATREELVKLTTLTPELAGWTVFLDGAKLNFNNLSQRDSVELLMTALQQPPWGQYHEHSKKVFANFKRDVEHAEEAHQTAQTDAADAARSLEEANQDVERERSEYQRQQAALQDQATREEASIAALRQTLTSSSEERTSIKRKLKQIEDANAETYAKVEQQKADVQRKRMRAQRFADRRRGRMQTAQADLVCEKRTLEQMKQAAVPSSCPRCNRPWERGHTHTEEEFESQRTKISDLEKLETRFSALLAEAQRDARTYEQQYNRIARESTNAETERVIREHSERYEWLEENDRDVNAKLTRAERNLETIRRGPSRSALDRKEGILEERQRQKAAADTKIGSAANDLAESQEALKVVAYWNDAFSPIGVPNMVLRDSIEPLNSVSRRISNLMSDGSLQISYQTKRTLASGADRPELLIKVDNKRGSKRVEGSSKGEAGLINLIIAETLAEVGAIPTRVGFRWYDECVNSQDPVIRRSIFNYLKELARRQDLLVFVVDHHPEAANYADHFLCVTKLDEKTSKVAWLGQEALVG
jgi:DNA repair exonuclease SbcCD ATPase subunit